MKDIRKFMMTMHEADKGGGGAGTNPGPEPEEPKGTPNEPTPEGDEADKKNGGEKLLTQAEVQKIIDGIVARERKRAEDQAEKERLEEEGKYRELYEKAVAEKESLEQQFKTEQLNRTKAKMVAEAGYSGAQVEFAVQTLKGETEEELKASMEALKQAFPPSEAHADPSPGNGPRHKPTPKPDAEYGKELFQRIKKR